MRSRWASASRTFMALLGLTGLAALVGCAQPVPNLYQWGSYESQIYAIYSEPGKVSTEEQVARLEADYQRARASAGQIAMPPGFHAHLGFLYFQLGKTDQALQSFRTESSLFPESKPYMDRLIARITR